MNETERKAEEILRKLKEETAIVKLMDAQFKDMMIFGAAPATIEGMIEAYKDLLTDAEIKKLREYCK